MPFYALSIKIESPPPTPKKSSYYVITKSWFVGKSFSNFKISKFMGSLYTAQYFDLKLEEWKRTFGFPVNFECMRDSCTIEIVDLEGKTHKMTFQKGGTMKFEKIEGKFRLSWNDNDLT